MPKSLTAQDIMNPEVMTVTNEMTVKELAGFLTDQEISGAPVEDENGALIGVVSVTDIVRAASSGGDRLMNGHDREAHFYTRGWEGKLSADELETLHLEDDELKVGEIMTPSVFAVEAEAPINTVAQSMMDSHLHRLLVVREGKVVGIVSTSDLLSLLAEID
ncbi:MAG: CBS domain-containing protein [Thermoanaerobaculia bacterium]|jgi:CBS domain-containing protein